MSFLDILHLALRNLRQAKLRATLTTMGVVVGVAVIVTMVSFGLGLQSNMLARFRALDLFNEILVYGRGLGNLAGLDRPSRRTDDGRRDNSSRADKQPTRILDDAGIKEIGAISGVAYVEPTVNFPVYVRSNGKLMTQFVGGANIPNSAARFQHFAVGQMISSASADEAVVTERFMRDYGYEKAADAVGKTIE
jgi:ABC-type lipoprotein release transport system permease subunit